MKITTPDLKNVNLFNLDDFEYMQYKRYTESFNMSKEKALQIIINNTEGDFSQLSQELSRRANKDKTFII